MFTHILLVFILSQCSSVVSAIPTLSAAIRSLFSGESAMKVLKSHAGKVQAGNSNLATHLCRYDFVSILLFLAMTLPSSWSAYKRNNLLR